MKNFTFNLKVSDLPRALKGISADIESGFSEQQIRELVNNTSRLGVDEKTHKTFDVEYIDKHGLLSISISSRNSSLVSITFISDIDGLIDEIEGLMAR